MLNSVGSHGIINGTFEQEESHIRCLTSPAGSKDTAIRMTVSLGHKDLKGITELAFESAPKRRHGKIIHCNNIHVKVFVC